jgi:lysophospholipase L1-like esterase
MKKDDRKLVILGDSHARGLSDKLKDKLMNSFEVIGYTKPNCDLLTLLSASNQNSVNLTKKDVLFLVAGMNDVISDSGVKELWHIIQYAMQNRQRNILLTPPLRYDQVSNVYINDNIKKFSRKLWKYMKLNEHVIILESPQNRDYFTRHGLHYNGYGKDIICSHLASSIKNLLQHTSHRV